MTDYTYTFAFVGKGSTIALNSRRIYPHLRRYRQFLRKKLHPKLVIVHFFAHTERPTHRCTRAASLTRKFKIYRPLIQISLH